MTGMFLGARYSADHATAEFRVFAPRATRVEVSIYAKPAKAPPVTVGLMTPSAFGAFSAVATIASLKVLGLGDVVYYGYRAWGPNWAYDPNWTPGSTAGFVTDVDRDGNRFNPNKLLLDPYALEVSHCPLTPSMTDSTVYQSGAAFRAIDTGPVAPKGIVLDVPPPAYGTKPTRAFKDDIIYEVHLRGLTRNDPAVASSLQGTYAGAATRAAYLKDLGITAVEFQPLHEMQNALNDTPGQLHDYWGYDSVSYFAPSRRYSSDASPGGPTRELQVMVKAFHDVGLKVYVDVVYNHHQEGPLFDGGGTVGVIYSLRGLANPNYYEDLGDEQQPNLYENDNGVGPNINAADTAARNLVLASLHYYVDFIGVDGFRFDLAAVLGNANADGGFQFDPNDPDGILNRAVNELPARPAAGGAGVDLIAEPYTAEESGQEQGNFPAGWSEWNDRFRDTVRASQNKLGIVNVTPGQLATRIAGSDDLFRARGRHPFNSLNYVVCHDGMTLHDLHSYDSTNNNAPPPFGPSDGGRDSNDEMCWGHGGILSDQQQAQRTSLGLLLLSAGVPMIGGGCEFRRTVDGNNNPDNLDTIGNWLDWSLALSEGDMVTFTRRLLQFRLAHPALRPASFFFGQDVTGTGAKDIAWYQDDGSEVSQGYFADPTRHFLAYALDGVAPHDPANLIYVAYNGWIDPVVARLPPLRARTQWYQVADTSAGAASYGFMHGPGGETLFTASSVTVAGRSLVLFLAR
jgi:isoamylase